MNQGLGQQQILHNKQTPMLLTSQVWCSLRKKCDKSKHASCCIPEFSTTFYINYLKVKC